MSKGSSSFFLLTSRVSPLAHLNIALIRKPPLSIIESSSTLFYSVRVLDLRGKDVKDIF